MTRTRSPLSWRRSCMLAVAACMILAPLAAVAAEQTLSLTYAFERPELVEITIDGQVYHRIAMPDCTNGGTAGQPALPATGAKILLPAGTSAQQVTIVPGERVFLGNYTIEPIGPYYKLSEGPESVCAPMPDPIAYASTTPLPAERFESIGTQSFRGYDILVLKLQPVEYIPATGELYYYTNLTVVVDAVQDAQANALYRGLAKDAAEVCAKVDNPQTAESYIETPVRDGRSYSLLILTTPAYVTSFQPLADYHNANGITTEIHTTDEVSGTTPDDVRDYIRQRYLLDGIDYVIIGGDDDIIPAQNLRVDYGDGSGAISDMPGDLFFSCLDGTWNYDNDSYWGEPNDGDNGGPLDLIADVYVGRAAIGSTTEAARFVNKTIWYLGGSHTLPEKVLFVGEYLGFGGVSEYAANTLEQLQNGSSADGYTTVGIPDEVYDFDELFERDWAGHSWPQSELINRINAGVHILNHLGHGDVEYAMKLYNSNILSSIHNTELCMVYSQTCLAGHFDGADCWAETMNIKIDYGAFAVLMNARYGFGQYNSTDGPSQRFNREFWDAVYSPAEAKPRLGPANSDSKEDNLYRINEDCMRWCYYEINLFGDPTVTVMGVDGFAIAADPSTQQVCSPPEDEAVFSIDVSQLGDFAEVVTLSVTGLPDGATAGFSVNDAVPPFSTVLTIGNLIGTTPGTYNLNLAGDSATMHRAGMAELRVNDGAPTAVALSTPADGETGVALMPELTWQAAAQTFEYELQVASDSSFTDVIYATTTSDTSHTLSDALDTLTRYYWRVRGANICGDGEWSPVFDFVTVNMVRPTAYDMLNGQTGLYTYYDDTYDGDGNPQQALSPLSGGLGDLTDGVIATQNWGTDHALYVGWKTVDPTITFHFNGTVQIDRVILYVDDSNGSGTVYVPQDVRIVMGGVTRDFDVTDPPGSEPCALEFGELGMEGDTMQVTIYDHNASSNYMMLSEVEFFSNQTLCVGDLDDDGDIDIADLAQLLANYGMSGMEPKDGDLDDDGDVDIADLAMLLSVYGTTCP